MFSGKQSASLENDCVSVGVGVIDGIIILVGGVEDVGVAVWVEVGSRNGVSVGFGVGV